MTDTSAPSAPRSIRVLFRIGWGVLAVLLAAFAVNHIAGIWYIAGSTDEAQMFELFGALNLLALVVLLLPYRRLERWAWWAMWIAIVPVALVLAFAPGDIGLIYSITAGVMALAQFATLPRFLGRAAARP